MKLLSLLTSRYLLLLLQQLISIWFLVDFFLARDSSNAHSLWKSKTNAQDSFSDIDKKINQVKIKLCPEDILRESWFDKVVIVVIDALGAKFIPAINNQHALSGHDEKLPRMPFLEKLITNNKAIGFTAKAATPTVTMPRIKALISGTIPSYADIVYNLVSKVSSFEDDNIVKIAQAHNKTLIFYGDDTWLSLFDKTTFKRSQETLSFFASDYTTVDTNVTIRAIPETEPTITDWDYLILHYLGLDHIGHVYGTNKHDLISKKLLEMDGVIKTIYDNMSSRDDTTLIVICGDHGMSEEGNHGGDSDLEANTAMVFLPINRKLHPIDGTDQVFKVNQIDFAVTLSLLTGMPIPSSSKGVFLNHLISNLWKDDEANKITCAALENARQLLNLIGHKEFIDWQESTKMIDLLTRHHLTSNNSHSQLADMYSNVLRQIQSKLLKSMASRSNPMIIIIVLGLVTLLTLYNLKKLCNRLLLNVIGKYERWACYLTFLVPIIMQGSTDFLEFEYGFWILYSLLVFALFTGISTHQNRLKIGDFDKQKIVFFTIFFLISSSWNKLDLVRDSIFATFITPAITLIILFHSIRQKSDIKYYRDRLVMVLCALIMLTKYIEESSDYNDSKSLILIVALQRVSLLAVIIHTIMNLFSSSELTTSQQLGSSVVIYKLASGWISIAFLLSRRYNFLFLISNVIMETSLNSLANTMKLSFTSRAIIYLTYAHSSFYNLGNTNSFSSIDVKPAFFGQTSYNIYISIPLVLTATFSTLIYWTMKLLQRIQEAKAKGKGTELENQQDCESLVRYTGDFVLACNFLSISYYMFVCLVLRNHLFIWSVISPKLLYHFVTNSILLITIEMISNIHRIKVISRKDNQHDS